MKKILLVDDSKVFLELEKNMLPRSEFDILEARNGQDALELVQNEHPDLILLDVNMPVMSGFEVLTALKSTEHSKDIPVIIITTRGREHDVQHALRLGADDYLTKPIDNRNLLIKVNSLLEQVKIRSSPRLPIRIEVEFGNQDHSYSGIIRDLSIGGALINSDNRVETGSKFQFQFLIPFEGGQRAIKTFAKILNVVERPSADDEGRFEMRIQFINLSRTYLFFIENLINRDTKTIASFLFSSPSQRKDYTEHYDKQRNEVQSALITELKTLSDDFYFIESIKKQFFGKYENLKNHLREAQLSLSTLAQKHARTEDNYSALSNLFVAIYQLYTRGSFASVVTVLEDITENLIGAEDFDIMLHNVEQEAFISLRKKGEFGYTNFPEAALAQISEGNLYLQKRAEALGPDGPRGPLAIIPLLLQKNLLGCILINDLFPQQQTLDNVSKQICEVLSHHAGPALFSTMKLEQQLSSDPGGTHLLGLFQDYL